MPISKCLQKSEPLWKGWDRKAQKNGLRHQVYAVSDDCYVGEWKDNMKHENGNRYEGCWRRGMKNGSGRFFHLDHGQLFEGFWVDDVAKCGTMIDFGRDEAPEPTQFPIPKVGSTQQSPVATPERQNTAPPQPHPAWPGPAQPSPAQPGNRQVLFSVRASPRRLAAAHKADSTSKVGSTPKAGSPGLPCSSIQPLTASLQIKILDPDGVLEEALAMFKKTEED
ncbi:MORN repeat-containing protein 3 isoform X7 [Zalophus californianus]|uniref:MORN repeat-containing protein 3 isoform X7 n=1 Tax=Zalophus californianus TaxID=9704 RepID=A0A6J2BMV0_ZALCA|nr:MORN repeat-containing protein 3 isoform X7 [Zalophus californianus]